MSAVPFSPSQLEQLEAKLDDARVHIRRKQGVELRYLEGHDVIDTANAVFGYHAWSYMVTRLEQSAGVWLATIVLTVTSPDGDKVTREDVGVGIPAVARDQGEASPDAQETAIKGAVTDALKRALRTFGTTFGNSLYDKNDTTGLPAREEQPVRLQSHGGDYLAEEDARPCPTCGTAMTLRSGTTRDGRPYTAWFCNAKCGQKPLWLPDRKAS